MFNKQHVFFFFLFTRYMFLPCYLKVHILPWWYLHREAKPRWSFTEETEQAISRCVTVAAGGLTTAKWEKMTSICCHLDDVCGSSTLCWHFVIQTSNSLPFLICLSATNRPIISFAFPFPSLYLVCPPALASHNRSPLEILIRAHPQTAVRMYNSFTSFLAKSPCYLIKRIRQREEHQIASKSELVLFDFYSQKCMWGGKTFCGVSPSTKSL